jgi:segregation and condensation protein B
MEELDIKSEPADTPDESEGPASVAAPEERAPDDIATEPMALPLEEEAPTPVAISDTQLQAVLEALVYIAEEPLTLKQMATALMQPVERVESTLRRLMEEFEKAEHGIGIREVAGGFKMATKAEHHEAVRSFVKSLKPPLKLSLPALETLAVIAYQQPVTQPEIMAIRGVQGGGVLKTLLDRKLIAGAGRKNVIGKPILYKTTKEFLIQFGLKDIAELPSLKEFEEIRRMAFADTDAEPAMTATPVESAPVEATTEAPAEPQALPAYEAETPSASEPETQPALEQEPQAASDTENQPAPEPEHQPAAPDPETPSAPVPEPES